MEMTATIAGVLLVVWGLGEILLGVLYPRASSGPVAESLCYATNYATAGLWRRGPRFRRGWVSLIGPALMVAQIAAWGGMLWVGFSLIIWPHLGETIVASKGTSTDFVTAMYFCGYSLTTLGTGDLVPTSSAMRLLMVFQAALGFCFFTLCLTYMMSVHSALILRNQLAIAIECRTHLTGDPYVFLRDCIGQSPETVARDLASVTQAVQRLAESQHFYPVLHYFRFAEPHYAMSQILYFCLEVATVCRTLRCESGEASRPLDATGELWYAARTILNDTMQHFVRRDEVHDVTGLGTVEFAEYAMQYQTRYFGGSADVNQVTSRYQSLREHWIGLLQAFARAQGIEDLVEARRRENNAGELS